MGERHGEFDRQIVELEAGLAEGIAAAAAGDEKLHRRLGDRCAAICGQPLDKWRPAALSLELERHGDPLLVRGGEQDRHELAAIEKPGADEHAPHHPLVGIGRIGELRRKPGPDLHGDRRKQSVLKCEGIDRLEIVIRDPIGPGRPG